MWALPTMCLAYKVEGGTDCCYCLCWRRTRAAPQLTVRAHCCDVNVISWNALATFMLASGADDGGFRVWDLRTFGANAKAIEEGFVANFTYHRC